MFGAAAVRNKKRKTAAEKAELPRGPYIKPFGPRFDAAELPYFKYKKALLEAAELQQNLAKAKHSAARRKKAAKSGVSGGGGVSVAREKAEAAVAAEALSTRLEPPPVDESISSKAAAMARVSTFSPELIEARLKVRMTRPRVIDLVHVVDAVLDFHIELVSFA
jgi:hypothetical protein